MGRAAVVPGAQVREEGHVGPVADRLQGELDGVLPGVRVQFEAHQVHGHVGDGAFLELEIRRPRAEVVDPGRVGADRDERIVEMVGAAQREQIRGGVDPQQPAVEGKRHGPENVGPTLHIA